MVDPLPNGLPKKALDHVSQDIENKIEVLINF